MAVQLFAWNNTTLLEQNRQQLLVKLLKQMQDYEARYELSSDRVEEEMSAGRLRETAEICNWIIAIRSYRALKCA